MLGRGPVPSYLPFLLILLVTLAGLPIAHVAPSSSQGAEVTNGTTMTTATSHGTLTSTTEIKNPSTLQTTPLAATTSLADKTQTTITGRLAIAYPMDHPARYYLIDNLGSIELIPSPAGVGNLHRYEGATIQVTGNLVSQDNQRILYMDNWVTLEAAAFPAVSGSQSTVVILVEFSDNTASHTAAQIGQLVFGASGNAMNAYYIEVSYNSITVTGGYTSVWNKLSHPTTYYNVHDWGSSWSEYRKLAVDVVSLVDPYVNFASYQHYMMVFAGDWVWGARCSGLAISTADGVLVNTATFLRETYGMTVYAHEFGHDLGLPDLYDYSNSDPYNFIDGWDEMSVDNAQHFTSWSKIQLGWIPPSKIATFTGSTVTQTVSRIEYTTSGCHALKIKTSAMPTSFYFLVETRQKVGFDVNLPASAPDHGVLITKIDESKGDGAGIVQLVDANPSTQSSWDGDAVWQVGQTYTDSLYGFSVYVQSWTGTGFTITVSLTLPSAPVLVSPANGATGIGLTPTLSWSLVGGADAYQVAVYDGASLVLVGYSGSGSYTVPSSKLVSSSTYTWLVWAHNVAGWSNPSAVWSFTTGSIPSAPSLLSPSSGATDVSLTPTLNWSPVSSADAYQIAVYDGATLVLIGYSGAASYPVASARLSYGRTYTWFVWAHNAFGWSNPSAGWSFTTITASPPSAPVLLSPSNGATGVSLTPTLTWSASGFDACQIAIYDGATLVWVGYSGTTSRTVPGGVLVSGRTYTWLVWAHNAVGWSNPSAGWSFTTVSVPSAPSLLSPSDGASGVGLTPTLSWSPVSGADAYQIAVYDGASLVLVGYSGSGSYTVPSGRLVYGHTYTWLVWAHNGFGWSNPSTGWSFTTGVPSAPVLVSPANGAVGVGLAPTLQWSEDAASSTDAFQIAIYEGSTLIHVGYSGSGYYAVPSGKLVGGHSYTWVVWAHNGAGWSNPSTIWSFTA